jgi:hypothetical protein
VRHRGFRYSPQKTPTVHSPTRRRSPTERWIDGEVAGGSRIIDIGEPPGMPPSEFYNMELEHTDGYWNYFQDYQP